MYSHNICICMLHVCINTCVHRYILVDGETESETERQTEKEGEREARGSSPLPITLPKERERTHKQRQSETAEWYTTISYRTSAAHSRIRPICEARGKRGSTKAMLRKVTSSSPQITRCLGRTYLPLNLEGPKPCTPSHVRSSVESFGLRVSAGLPKRQAKILARNWLIQL